MSAVEIKEGNLTFTFAENAMVTKYDEWSFYRKQFQGAFGIGAKAVDLIYVGNEETWLIEVKDYREYRRTKPTELGKEIASKVRDTLAGLVAAKCYADDQSEKCIAAEALSRNRIRVALHLEQDVERSGVSPWGAYPSKMQLKLRQMLKAVDENLVIVDRNRLKPAMEWTVT